MVEMSFLPLLTIYDVSNVTTVSFFIFIQFFNIYSPILCIDYLLSHLSCNTGRS